MIGELIDSGAEWIWASAQGVWRALSDPRAWSDPATWQWAAPLLAGAATAWALAWAFKRGRPAAPDAAALLLPGHAELLASPLAMPLDRDLLALAGQPERAAAESPRASRALARRLRVPWRALQSQLDRLPGGNARLAALLEVAQRHRRLQERLAMLDERALEPEQRDAAQKWLREGRYDALDALLCEPPERAEAGAVAERLECAAESAALAGLAERATEHWERALNAWLASDDPRGCIGAMAHLVWLRRRAGEAAALIDECERWLHLLRSLSDMHDADPAFHAGLVSACLRLGDACYVGGERARAREAYGEALSRLGRSPDSSPPNALAAALAHQRLAVAAPAADQRRAHASAAARALRDSAACASRLGSALLASTERLAA